MAAAARWAAARAASALTADGPDWEAAGGAPKADPGGTSEEGTNAPPGARGAGFAPRGGGGGTFATVTPGGGGGGDPARARARARAGGEPHPGRGRDRGLLAAAPTTALARGLVRHPRSRVPRASERAIERPIVARVATRGGLCARSRSRPPVGQIARSTEVWNVIDDSELSLVVSPLALLSPFRLGTPDARHSSRRVGRAPRGVLALRDVALRDVPPTPRAGAARRFRDPRRGCRRAPPGAAVERARSAFASGATRSIRPARRRRAVRARGGRPRARVVRVRRVRAMEIDLDGALGPPWPAHPQYEVLVREHVRALAAYLRRRARELLAPGTSPLVVLEVGAGDGRLARHLTRAVRDMDAADPTVVSADRRVLRRRRPLLLTPPTPTRRRPELPSLRRPEPPEPQTGCFEWTRWSPSRTRGPQASRRFQSLMSFCVAGNRWAWTGPPRCARGRACASTCWWARRTMGYAASRGPRGDRAGSNPGGELEDELEDEDEDEDDAPPNSGRETGFEPARAPYEVDGFERVELPEVSRGQICRTDERWWGARRSRTVSFRRVGGDASGGPGGVDGDRRGIA